MKKATQVIAILFLLLPATILAQVKKHFALSGTIKDKSTGETLPGATVSFLELSGTGISANTYGYYSISVPEGNYTVLATYTGFKTDTFRIELKSNLQHNFGL